MEIKQVCKNCDSLCETKGKGIICYNPKSDNFNQNVELTDSCEHIETNFYITPTSQDNGLFEES